MKDALITAFGIVAGLCLMVFALFLSALPYAVVLALAIAIVRCTGVI